MLVQKILSNNYSIPDVNFFNKFYQKNKMFFLTYRQPKMLELINLQQSTIGNNLKKDN